MIAMTAANANAPATMSFGLRSRIRIARPCSASASALGVRVPRRRRGISSSLAVFLGTFFHLLVTMLRRGSRGRSKDRNIARWLLWQRERQRQRNDHAGTFVDPALHGEFAAMQGHQRF